MPTGRNNHPKILEQHMSQQNKVAEFDEALTLQKRECGHVTAPFMAWCACLYIAKTHYDTSTKIEQQRWIFTGTMNFVFNGPWNIDAQDPNTPPAHAVEHILTNMKTKAVGRSIHIYMDYIYDGMAVGASEIEMLVHGTKIVRETREVQNDNERS